MKRKLNFYIKSNNEHLLMLTLKLCCHKKTFVIILINKAKFFIVCQIKYYCFNFTLGLIFLIVPKKSAKCLTYYSWTKQYAKEIFHKI